MVNGTSLASVIGEVRINNLRVRRFADTEAVRTIGLVWARKVVCPLKSPLKTLQQRHAESVAFEGYPSAQSDTCRAKRFGRVHGSADRPSHAGSINLAEITRVTSRKTGVGAAYQSMSIDDRCPATAFDIVADTNHLREF